jgi:hypothetical protein
VSPHGVRQGRPSTSDRSRESIARASSPGSPRKIPDTSVACYELPARLSVHRRGDRLGGDVLDAVGQQQGDGSRRSPRRLGDGLPWNQLSTAQSAISSPVSKNPVASGPALVVAGFQTIPSADA